MNHYEETEVPEPELLFDSSANETDETSETDESLGSEEGFDSDHSLGSDESPDLDEDLEVVDKINPLASVSADDEQEQDNGGLQDDGDALHAREEELDQVEGVQMEASTSDDVKVAPKKSKWLTQWFRWQEDLY